MCLFLELRSLVLAKGLTRMSTAIVDHSVDPTELKSCASVRVMLANLSKLVAELRLGNGMVLHGTLE
jgi:hypothetical protein